jgi:hypothetical protein
MNLPQHTYLNSPSRSTMTNQVRGMNWNERDSPTLIKENLTKAAELSLNPDNLIMNHFA